jgi:hypothetical protein
VHALKKKVIIQRIRIYEDLERVFDKSPKCHIKILSADFNANIRREDIFKPIIRNESVHEINNVKG